ncbi:sulfotransferase [Pseudohalioglobus sediminis]|uniref:Sulfotransferase n=2 Tax=Pseudohalioglobus sediminis TaxID=2606449 RepID=A0A5B0WY67_9GAMM|nr:sulfotransferase [Pseudohalioglobus sediminis]
MMHDSARFLVDPVCMGGVGGSGTRVGAEIMQALGIYLGPLLNTAKDNFSFPPLASLLQEVESEAERETIVFKGLAEFEHTMQENFLEQDQQRYRSWGWKIPGSFYWLPYTSRYFPRMRYVHFMRHGLDMAFSGNRNQIKNWGWRFGIEHQDPPTPEDLLAYWIAANNHAIATASELLGDRFLLVDFDALCCQPETEVRRLGQFLQPDASEDEITGALALVHKPGSMQRYRKHDVRSRFAPESIAAVEALGFTVE